MMGTLSVRVDRTRCIGAGNCIHIAPTAFDWMGDHAKVEVLDPSSVEEEIVREAAIACPTQAIEVDVVEELLPWQMRQRSRVAQRVVRTFMFTDIVGSTNLLELLGDDAWHDLLRWHDETLRGLFTAFQGEEVTATGDGFFVSFDSPDAALACAVAIQRRLLEQRQKQGFSPQVRIGVHASGATQVGRNFQGRGVHEAARIAAIASGGKVLASRDTATGGRYPVGEPRSVTLKGISEPLEIVEVLWR
jgi:class 3 adenylate cyclase